nr:TPA_asm: ATP synthase F0 subunit 6 [Euschistus heros]
MMTNLFSTFDPATSINYSLNWMSTFLGLMIIPYPFWMMPNRMSMVFNSIINKLHFEFKLLLGEKSNGMSLMMISLFTFILLNNFMGLMPYIFTSSSHLAFSLTLALPLWLSMMIYGWMQNTNSMFAHLVPSGTPAMLMPFMVLIETISNIIRPGSLAVRLTANMIAGHLLMSLLGNKSLDIESYLLTFIIIIQMMLMMFEAAVAIIQAYVFSVLTTLYSSEVMN